MIRFLAEISKKHDIIILPTPSTRSTKINQETWGINKNIYELDISPHPKSSYWTEWGGIYDSFSGNEIELYFGGFLVRVDTIDELYILNNSLFIEHGKKAYINLPRHPWLYEVTKTQSENVVSFLSSVLRENNPSNNIMRGKNIPVKMDIPSLSVKLSDSISGIVLNQSFQVSLHNNDGYFDNDITWNLFNTPISVKKAVKDNPEYEDFKTIRRGFVENATTDFNNFKVEAADKQKTLDNQVCHTLTDRWLASYVTGSMLPAKIDIDKDSLNKNIPIVYGKKRVSLLKLSPARTAGFSYFIAAEYIEGAEVYDKDGNELRGLRVYNNVIINAPNEADSAVITGYQNNKISEIIIDIINKKSDMVFGATNWNTAEYARYNEISLKVNIAITGGTVISAIQSVLKSDMVFLIQQNNGKFTLRSYRNRYKAHKLLSTMIIKKPEKNYAQAQRGYFSSCVVNYDFSDKDVFKSFLSDEKEPETESMYRKLVRTHFNTDLAEEADAKILARTLSSRYTRLKQTLKIAIATDASEYELLDRVIFDGVINERIFSKGEYFIIKELDSAQDSLVLEEIDFTDLTGEYPDTETHEYIADGLFASTQGEEYGYVFDAGGV
jgi:hypothetical protein